MLSFDLACNQTVYYSNPSIADGYWVLTAGSSTLATKDAPNGFTVTPDTAVATKLIVTAPDNLLNTVGALAIVYYTHQDAPYPAPARRFSYTTFLANIVDVPPVAEFLINNVAPAPSLANWPDLSFTFDGYPSEGGARKIQQWVGSTLTTRLTGYGDIVSYAWSFRRLNISGIGTTEFATADTMVVVRPNETDRQYTAVLTVANSFGTTGTKSYGYSTMERQLSAVTMPDGTQFIARRTSEVFFGIDILKNGSVVYTGGFLAGGTEPCLLADARGTLIVIFNSPTALPTHSRVFCVSTDFGKTFTGAIPMWTNEYQSIDTILTPDGGAVSVGAKRHTTPVEIYARRVTNPYNIWASVPVLIGTLEEGKEVTLLLSADGLLLATDGKTKRWISDDLGQTWTEASDG